MLKWLWLSGIVVLLDQITKYAAVARLQEYQPAPFLPLLDLTLMYNEGAAFSFLSTAGGWQRWLFTLLALVISAIIVVWLLRLQQHRKLEAAGLALVLGGALGNVIDRIFLGHVVDFLDFRYQAESCLPLFVPVRNGVTECHWPAFNLADSAISIGVALLIIDSLRSALAHRKQKKTG
ncbi:MAG TPA: signal peptidase II [Chromatiales bacterium]|nr:signal peptidase II [Chromatiales bacterium]